MLAGHSVRSSLCQQSTLHAFISSITPLYRTKPETGISILLRLTTTASCTQASQQDPISQLLFDEDKTNCFVEQVELLQCVAKEIKKLLPLVSDKSVLLQQLRSDSLSLQDELLHGPRSSSLLKNPWMETNAFSGAAKLLLLANALEGKEEGEIPFSADILRTITTHPGSVHPLLTRLATRRDS